MKQFFTLIFFLSVIISFAQDTTYYWGKVSSNDSVYFNKLVQRDQEDTNKAYVRIYYKSWKIASEAKYSDYGKKQEEGVFNGYFENGQLKEEANYKERKVDGKLKDFFDNGQIREDIDFKDGKWNGMYLTYWKNGKPKRIETYKNDTLIEGKCFTSDGNDTDVSRR